MSQTPVRDPARTAADTGMLQTLEWRHSTPSSMVRTAAPLSRVVGHNLGGFTRILQAAELVQPSRHRSIQRLGGPDQKLNLESQGFWCTRCLLHILGALQLLHTFSFERV